MLLASEAVLEDATQSDDHRECLEDVEGELNLMGLRYWPLLLKIFYWIELFLFYLVA